jgi:hypothetical protein
MGGDGFVDAKGCWKHVEDVEEHQGDNKGVLGNVRKTPKNI